MAVLGLCNEREAVRHDDHLGSARSKCGVGGANKKIFSHYIQFCPYYFSISYGLQHLCDGVSNDDADTVIN